jgi:hypothetical protein
MMSERFLCKTVFAQGELIETAEGPVLDHHARIQRYLRARVGPEAAALFAEPLISRGNDQARPTISWYAGAADEDAQPLSGALAGRRAAAEQWLVEHLRPVEALVSHNDDPDAQLVAEALILRGADDVWLVGERPVLVNWGMAPEPAAADPALRRRHAVQTLGRYMPLAAQAMAPAAAAWAATLPAAAAQGPGPGLDGVSAPAGGTQGPGTVAPVAPAAALPALAWVPLVVLLTLAGLALVWLLLPMTRILPAARVQAAQMAESAALSAEANRDLRLHRDRLRAALDAAVCRPDGTLVLPDGRTPEGLLPPPVDAVPGDPLVPAVRQGSASPLVPPPARRVIAPESSTGQAASSLLERIENSTVFVMALSGTNMGSGTGFVVGEGLILTNHHVIDVGAGADIRVLHPALAQPVRAQVVAQNGPLESTGGDFALLRITETGLPVLAFQQPEGSLRLSGVVAAGYPGDVLDSDAAFQGALQSGRLPAPPMLTVTDGIVNAEQVIASGAQVVIHSAPLSSGNSGGPLFDLCGRVIGVNTFVRRGPLRTLNFALSSADALAFLAQAGHAAAVENDACAPMVLSPVPQAAAPVEDL